MKKLIVLIISAIFLLSGCSGSPSPSEPEIPRGTWPPREDGAEPYVYEPDKIPEEREETGEYAPPEAKRKTPAEKMAALPQDDSAQFLAFPIDDAYSLSKELFSLLSPVIEAEQQWSEAEKESPEWFEIRDRLFEAYGVYAKEFNFYEEEANRRLAESFIEAGFNAKVVAEEYMHYGAVTRLCAVWVEGTPAQFREAIKTLPGILSADVYEGQSAFRYNTVIWEGEP